MGITEIAFYILAAIGVISALVTVTARHPIYSILGLVTCFFSISGHYILMNAQFLGLVNIIVYAGAIIVLFLFVVMMMNLGEIQETSKNLIWKIMAALAAGCLMLVLVAALKVSDNLVSAQPDNNIGLVETLGNVLLHEYLVPFIMTSILLNAAMIGAVLLSNKENKLQNI
ncbi:MAG: NADH-quinone oxidoreductase subunit J [Chitinophagales bacterium]|nr:NADH-quinone oxidoreductase subunit J [Chitinophagales bacterium]